ncbi:SDR family NAD(P)-dependent oxidoreductase [Brevibacillus migulae]|uniref:SDR family NAD(P)-dependent oxidoreductase n=1 Tax=Brevibacillus migulae TaxID=1644114 RepID=UPI00106E7ADC|nr:SDR family oxidoreductase [Brevibacillus migulae]
MKNYSALITGASSGIGYEFAKILAKEKIDLILVARNLKRLEEIRDELSRFDVSITLIEKDLSLPHSAEDVYNEVKNQDKHVDILINSAGVGLLGRFIELDLQKQLEMIQLNMTTLTQLTHLFLQDMVNRNFGRIINVASIASFVSTPLLSVYAASKAYVLSFTESLNTELEGKGDIMVTALCPGPTKTNFARAAHMESIEDVYHQFSISPSVVAEAGYQALQKKKSIVIPEKKLSISLFVTRFLPRKWLQYTLGGFWKLKGH